MRPVRAALVILVVILAGMAGFWAGRTALRPPPDPVQDSPDTLEYTVGMDTVGRSLSFAAVAEWELAPIGRNGADGVLTTVETEPGASVSAGEVVYTVDLRPVVVAEGAVPMFRQLNLRTSGPDVAQLQRLLTGLGFYSGEADGAFGASTRSAVRDWQESLGIQDDGVVQGGDLVFVESLPARVTFASTVTVGAKVAAGDEVLFSVPQAPTFAIPLSPEQASLVPLTAQVEVIHQQGTWSARIERAVERENGQLDLILEAAAGGTVCADTCVSLVDLDHPTSFRANIIVIPETTGPAVPVAAIATDPGNRAYVTLANGSQLPVTIVESANGLAIVEGIDAGTVILVPAAEE